MDNIPLGVLTDSYKASHSRLYPVARERTAYGEFRCSFDKDCSDQRILFYGLTGIIKKYVARRWTSEDIENTTNFFSTHNIGNTPFPFPRELFEKIVKERDGWFPIRIMGLAEGSVIYPHTPVYVIRAEQEYSGLVTWLETILTMVWYPSTVATLSRRIKDIIEEAFVKSVEREQYFLIDSRLHDFGFRGCTSVEQAVIGGTAHLLNFKGTDTAAAAYNVQFNLNGGKAIGESIPATEHSIMTAHTTEREAILRVIEEFGQGTFACVMDSYDYMEALRTILPSIANYKIEKGGFMVLRPDSGDPLEVVLAALSSAEMVFGAKVNSLGYKVIIGCGVIQGDGVDSVKIKRVLDGVLNAGYSAQNVAFGMGSNLLHQVNRDTMSFATKLSHSISVEGESRDTCKVPKTDWSKVSLPGLFSVQLSELGIPTVYPVEDAPKGEELLQLYYDNGPVNEVHLQRSFDEIRKAVKENWESLPKIHNALSLAMQSKVAAWQQSLN